MVGIRLNLVASGVIHISPLVAAACSETLAWIAGEQHHARRAAILMGAADALGDIAGGSAFMFPDLLVYRDECTWNRYCSVASPSIAPETSIPQRFSSTCRTTPTCATPRSSARSRA